MQPTTMLSRRGFVASAGLAWAAASIAPRMSFAAEPDGPVQLIRKAGPAAKVTVTPLRRNVSMVEGSGGNITVLHGPEGRLLVDAGVSRPNLEAAIDSISKQPVRYVLNSHWHFDHTDGNAWLHSVGATIIAHANTRKRLSTATRVEAWNFEFPPSPRAALPTVVFQDESTLHFDDTTVALKGYAPCHTDTDIRVTFVEVDVVAVGDTWWNGHYPFIDYSTGGSIDGTIRAAEENVQAVGDSTIIVPGHGPAGDRRQLIEYRDMLRSVRDAVSALKKQGKSADAVVAAHPTARYDAKWGTFVVSPETFTRLVYAGV